MRCLVVELSSCRNQRQKRLREIFGSLTIQWYRYACWYSARLVRTSIALALIQSPFTFCCVASFLHIWSLSVLLLRINNSSPRSSPHICRACRKKIFIGSSDCRCFCILGKVLRIPVHSEVSLPKTGNIVSDEDSKVKIWGFTYWSWGWRFSLRF